MSTNAPKRQNGYKSKDQQHVQTHRPRLHKARCCDVTIHNATGLHNGLLDMFDTPDAYVELHCQEAVEKHHKTAVIRNERNPDFNETKTFTLTGDSPMIDIMVKEENLLLDGVHGKCKCKLEDTPNVIKLNGKAELMIDISCKMESPDIRSGSGLCEGEKTFCQARSRHVRQALRNLLGNHILQSDSVENVPNIAVLGSGGGFRALMALSGAFRALQDSGILDCVMYTVGLSGSAWYLSTLCSHPDWPHVHPSVVDEELQKCVGKPMWDTILSLGTLRSSYREKGESDRPWAFTDLFGHWIGQTLVPERMYSRWSDQREKVRDGHCPLPLLSCVHADKDTPTQVFHEWVEISPFEVHIPKYATSVKMEDFGSEFYKGKMTRETDELPLHCLMGICGSAYTALHKSFSEMSAKSHKLSRSSRGSEDDPNTTGSVDEGLCNWIDYVKNILDRFGLNYLDDRTGRAAQVHNFMRQLTLEEVDELVSPADYCTDSEYRMAHEKMDTKDKYMCLIDAGLVYNSPYPIILRAERKVDLILSFEFSDRGQDSKQPFEQLLLAKEWADCRKVPFPPISTDQYKDSPVEELYIFQDEADLTCPIILHFVLVNNHFRTSRGMTQSDEDGEFADFSIFDDNGTYDSLKFEFTETQFSRISKLMEFNVHHCLDKVKDCILKCIQRRKQMAATTSYNPCRRGRYFRGAVV